MKRLQFFLTSSFIILVILVLVLGCNNGGKSAEESKGKSVRLVTLDPGHFHAALIHGVLYIEPIKNDWSFDKSVHEKFKKISAKFSGVELYKFAKGWSVKLPENLAEGHEAHFARVTNNFLEYLGNLSADRQDKNMPAWEVPNMLSKYYTITKALEIDLKKKS